MSLRSGCVPQKIFSIRPSVSITRRNFPSLKLPGLPSTTNMSQVGRHKGKKLTRTRRCRRRVHWMSDYINGLSQDSGWQDVTSIHEDS